MKKRIIIAIIILFVLVPACLYTYIKITAANIHKLPPIYDGDMIFQTIKSSQTLAIMLASKSPYTHVGIIQIDEDNTVNVIEAVGPVRKIALGDWVKQGVAERITIMRHKNITQDQIHRTIERAETYYGRPYDFYFLFDKERIYCSELVYYAFKEGAGLSLGKIQKVEELDLNNSATQNLLRSRWKNYAPCVKANITTFEGCLPLITSQDLITPQSLADDNNMQLIYSNYEHE